MIPQPSSRLFIRLQLLTTPASAFPSDASLCVQLNAAVDVRVDGMDAVDPEDLGGEEFLVLVVSTYTDGRPPAQAKVGSDASAPFGASTAVNCLHPPMLTEGCIVWCCADVAVLL